ncbi:DUF488 domain-containing protein [Cyanobacterium stanieri LEGE 03274]|uniref:DUF488 domain-containing protein n=1 Tax=Cyanobacterium stanieri LEGE 03274 TaxID=1828756 RepID=A0ABR9V1K4_9CHRO|nr:DUF488 domain-containing protein [Cyanobacterium stanieri]MBE9221772.1 DUF488 domain-containing protein [Cyanobacterium stanieri LEGE 03274]
MKIFTIGHSNHQIEQFIFLLQLHQVTAIADVRSIPYSRYNQQYNQKNLQNKLKQNKIAYSFLGDELGARSKNPNCYVKNQAIYEKIAQTEEFLKGLTRLIKGTNKHNIALMCAEKDPINCHRAILISRYLSKQNITILHILSNGQLESQNQLEKRLLDLLGLNTPKQLNLFDFSQENSQSEDDLIEDAYHIQGTKIAYLRK